MENSDDTRLIVKIAQLRCKQDVTQAWIACELGIYRTTTSRLLERGRDQGIITIAINCDYGESLQLKQQAKRKFSLKDTVVVSGNDGDEDTQLAMMRLHDARLPGRLLKPGDIVSFSWSRVVSALIENLLQAEQSRQPICAPITGDPSGKLGGRYHIDTLAYSAAVKLKGESRLADFPALPDSPLIHNGIMRSRHFRTIFAYQDNLDVAPVGIGSPAARDGASQYAFYGGEESSNLDIHQIADNTCSRFSNIYGAVAGTNMSKKALSIEVNKLEQARYSINTVISGGKYSGIVGMLRRKYVNCLIANSNTAEPLPK